MFCAPGIVIGGSEGVGSHLHVLQARTHFRRYLGRWGRFHVSRAQTHFRRYRGRRDPFSCFTLTDSFSAVPRASGPFFMICAPGLVFVRTEGVGSRFHVLRARNRFWRYRGHQVPFSCFAVPEFCSAVPSASGPVFMFCAPGIVTSGSEGFGSHFHVLHARIRFRRYIGRRGPFSCFALPDSFLAVPRVSGPFSCFAIPVSFSAVPRASGTIFMFSAPRLIFGGTKGVGSLFHVLRARTRFRLYRGRRDPFSCFALPDSFSAVPRGSGPIFMFCAHELIFGGTEGVGSLFHVLCSLTRFRRYRGRRISFSCFAITDSFSAVSRASRAVFMFCTPGLIFGGTEGVRFLFHVLRSRTHLRRYRGHQFPFSCFALSESCSSVPSASGPVFMFCAPGIIIGGSEGVGSRFHFLRSWNRYRR
jgi:hypothetical protein